MDSSSQIVGGSEDEECHSSESGWTMYIGSPMDDDDNNGGEDEVVEEFRIDRGIVAAANDDSDDSMVSDASSGVIAHSKEGKKTDCQRKAISNRKGKQMAVEKNNGCGVKKVQTSVHVVVPAQSGILVRRNWFGSKKL